MGLSRRVLKQTGKHEDDEGCLYYTRQKLWYPLMKKY